MRCAALSFLIALCAFISACRGLDPSAPLTASPTPNATSASPAPPSGNSPASPPAAPALEDFYWTSAEGNAGFYKLNPDTGEITKGQENVHLSGTATLVGTEDSPSELNFASSSSGADTVTIANRDSSTGTFSISSTGRFPSDTQIQSSALSPNGQYAYVITDGDGSYGTGDFVRDIYLKIYQRDGDGRFSQRSQSVVATDGDYSLHVFSIRGIVRTGNANYLAVNEATLGHPGTTPNLNLWKLSPDGSSIEGSISVSRSDDGSIVSGWSGAILLSSGNLDFSHADVSYFQYVYRINGDKVDLIAQCDAASRSDCPSVSSYAVVPSSKQAYAVSPSRPIQLVTWDEASEKMTFSDIQGTSVGFEDRVYVDPSGSYLLLAGSSAKQLRIFKIEKAMGSLHEVPGSPFSMTDTIRDLAFIP
jgi:hypothetical protein